MGGRRRPARGRQVSEIGVVLGFTAIWVVVALWSFWPVRQESLTPLLVSTVIVAAVWVAAVVIVRVRSGGGETLAQLHALSPAEFEEWVAARFREQGYRVEVTGMSGDHGADLSAEKDGERAIVQCKRYRTTAVGEPVLRDLYGAMYDYGAERAYLVTTGRLTAAARAWARGKSISIWDGGHLARLAKVASAAAAGSPGVTEAAGAAGHNQPAPPTQFPRDGGTPGGHPACPRCGAAVVVRQNCDSGKLFLGCSRFPECRYTQDIEP